MVIAYKEHMLHRKNRTSRRILCPMGGTRLNTAQVSSTHSQHLHTYIKTLGKKTTKFFVLPGDCYTGYAPNIVNVYEWSHGGYIPIGEMGLSWGNVDNPWEYGVIYELHFGRPPRWDPSGILAEKWSKSWLKVVKRLRIREYYRPSFIIYSILLLACFYKRHASSVLTFWI